MSCILNHRRIKENLELDASKITKESKPEKIKTEYDCSLDCPQNKIILFLKTLLLEVEKKKYNSLCY